MSDKDYGIADPRERDFGRERAGNLAPVVTITVAAIKLILSFFFGAQGLVQCADPGGCTDTPILVFFYSNGMPNIAGMLLMAGLAVLVVGVLLLIFRRRRMKRIQHQ